LGRNGPTEEYQTDPHRFVFQIISLNDWKKKSFLKWGDAGTKSAVEAGCYDLSMRSAGFVLVGGKSSRMGRDKALLPFQGGSLAGHVAAQVAQAAGCVTLIGSPEIYKPLGYPVVGDLRPGQGPLSGVETALSLNQAEWNLIVACDLPLLSATLFDSLLQAAAESEADCVIPVSADGQPQPLAAVWNLRLLSRVRSALDEKQRKVMKAVENCRILWWPAAGSFENMNTPQDWKALSNP
jgi:molybdopterin-guanine dinucleotide biosynthesis protein A